MSNQRKITAELLESFISLKNKGLSNLKVRSELGVGTVMMTRLRNVAISRNAIKVKIGGVSPLSEEKMASFIEDIKEDKLCVKELAYKYALSITSIRRKIKETAEN